MGKPYLDQNVGDDLNLKTFPNNIKLLLEFQISKISIYIFPSIFLIKEAFSFEKSCS